MRKLVVPIAIASGLALALSVAVIGMAHEGSGEEEIVVEPASVTAGETVVLAGSGLEPDTDRVLVLAGGDLIVQYGIVRTDAEGTFTKELTIPSHLPSGSYELRAIGDETLTTPLAITAPAGGAAASPASDAQETIVPRVRTPIELGVLLVLTALVALAGGVLVWRAEHVRGAPGA